MTYSVIVINIKCLYNPQRLFCFLVSCSISIELIYEEQMCLKFYSICVAKIQS